MHKGKISVTVYRGVETVKTVGRFVKSLLHASSTHTQGHRLLCIPRPRLAQTQIRHESCRMTSMTTAPCKSCAGCSNA